MNRETHLATALAVGVAAVVGCTSIPSVGPDYKEPTFEAVDYQLPDAGQPTTNLTVGAEYRPAEEKDDTRVEISKDRLAQWWTRFDDPVLVSLIEGGVSNNVGYLMACKRLEQAEYERLGSFANTLPHFSVGAGWTRRWSSLRTSSGKRTYNTRNFALDGSWELDVFGGTRRQIEAAVAEAEAAGWTVADAWVSLTTQIGQQYINLRTVQERIDTIKSAPLSIPQRLLLEESETIVLYLRR